MKMKFQDMPAGQHFTDGDRKFIKLSPTTAGGIPQTHERIVQEAHLSFNAVDYKGCVASCPDWLEYKCI